ncbi:MAG TPA: hypothetical protein VMT64_08300, partial [Candidatus Binataceae bacterium]|nr:hypothetical protein [Candidatus Binataceae bacterium]
MGLKNLSIKTKLTVLSGIFVLGMAMFGLVTWEVLSEVKIGGSLYPAIEMSETINSDFDKPLGHLVSTRLTLFKMIAAAYEHKADDVQALVPEFEK